LFIKNQAAGVYTPEQHIFGSVVIHTCTGSSGLARGTILGFVTFASLIRTPFGPEDTISPSNGTSTSL
jgi:hypothetical protein